MKAIRRGRWSGRRRSTSARPCRRTTRPRSMSRPLCRTHSPAGTRPQASAPQQCPTAPAAATPSACGADLGSGAAGQQGRGAREGFAGQLTNDQVLDCWPFTFNERVHRDCVSHEWSFSHSGTHGSGGGGGGGGGGRFGGGGGGGDGGCVTGGESVDGSAGCSAPGTFTRAAASAKIARIAAARAGRWRPIMGLGDDGHRTLRRRCWGHPC